MEEMKPVKSSYEHDGLKMTLETNQHCISDVLEAVENVLRGSGFCFRGNIEVVDPDAEMED
jgi:hypothetical protein